MPGHEHTMPQRTAEHGCCHGTGEKQERAAEQSCCHGTGEKHAPKAMPDAGRRPAAANVHERPSAPAYWRKVLGRIWGGDRGPVPGGSA